MRLIKLLGLLTILLGISTLSLVGAGEKNFDPKEPLQASKAEIKWHDYDVGLKKAKDINRHVFIDFTAKWCGYCKKMDREVFSDPRIIDLLNNDFVSVRVDGDSRRELDIDGYKITEQNLAKSEFGVRGYPTFWFLKPDGSKLTLIGGYRPTDYMLEALTFVKDYKYDSTVTETDKDTLEN